MSSNSTFTTFSPLLLATVLTVSATVARAQELVPSISIDSMGSVGVGTESPDAKLEILGRRLNNVDSDPCPSGYRESSGRPDCIQQDLLHLSTSSHDYGKGGRLKFGDRKYVYLQEFVDDSLKIFAENDIALMTDCGNVGIGTKEPAYDLDVAGTVRVTDALRVDDRIYVNGEIVHSSDLRRKTGVTTLRDTLAKVVSLRGVSFLWKDRPSSTRRHLGVIAQEVEAQFPDLVDTGTDGLKSVDYNGLIAPLIEAVKELAARNARLEAEKKSEISTLTERLGVLEAAVAGGRGAALNP